MALEGSSYKATMSKQAEGSFVEFYVSVTDIQVTVSESGKFSYIVGGGLELPGLEVPCFPLESIIIGLAVGFIILLFSRKKDLRYLYLILLYNLAIP